MDMYDLQCQYILRERNADRTGERGCMGSADMTNVDVPPRIEERDREVVVEREKEGGRGKVYVRKGGTRLNYQSLERHTGPK